MKTKSVEFAYPSSPQANRFGFAKLGCYVVELSEGTNPPIAIAGYFTKLEAWQHADTLPEPWSPSFTRFTPQH